MEVYIPAIATLVVGGLRSLWFTKDSTARDKLLPVLVLVANLLGQIVAMLTGESNGGLLGSVGGGTLASLGLYRGWKWTKDLLSTRPPQ